MGKKSDLSPHKDGQVKVLLSKTALRQKGI